MYVTKAEGVPIQAANTKKTVQKNTAASENAEEFETLIADAVELSDPNNKKDQQQRRDKKKIISRLETEKDDSDERGAFLEDSQKTDDNLGTLNISA